MSFAKAFLPVAMVFAIVQILFAAFYGAILDPLVQGHWVNYHDNKYEFLFYVILYAIIIYWSGLKLLRAKNSKNATI